jgi:HK97 family phage major capsid protein
MRSHVGPFGYPYRVAPLPTMATAGTTDPSVWFTDLGACYRIVDRSGISVQRLKERYKEA